MRVHRHVILPSFSFAREGAPGNTTPGAADRIRGCRAPSSRDRRGRAFPERIAGRRRPRAGAWRTSGGAGAGGRAVGSSPAFSASLRRIRNAPARVSGAAARVQEELRAVAAVEVRPAAREVAAQRLGGVAADRDDALLAALADHADEPVVEVDAGPVEPDRLRDPEAGAVEQLDERLVAERARLRAARRPRSAAPPRRARASSAAASVRRGSATAAAGLSPRTPSSC